MNESGHFFFSHKAVEIRVVFVVDFFHADHNVTLIHVHGFAELGEAAVVVTELGVDVAEENNGIMGNAHGGFFLSGVRIAAGHFYLLKCIIA